MGERIDADVEQRLVERAMPTVVVDAPSDVFSVVATDETRGGRLAAKHLLDLGHRSMGYLVERQVADYASQARRRLAGFTAELNRVEGTDLVVSATSASIEQARSAARDLLSRPQRPTALMAHYDDLAIGALQAARDLGLRVPEDVSVMGFDDGPGAVAAGLSTVRQPFVESGAIAGKMLKEAMTGDGPRIVTTLDCTLVTRDSTAARAV
jgi:LacI family transcriptional regulator